MERNWSRRELRSENDKLEEEEEEEGERVKQKKRKGKWYKEMKWLQKQQVSLWTGYEWLLHILQLCNLREEKRVREREKQDGRVIKWEAICYFYTSILSPSSSNPHRNPHPLPPYLSPSFVCSAAQKFLNMIMRGCQRCSNSHAHTHHIHISTHTTNTDC